MKRLYIGGLGHTVSEKDLKDRFGKFGDVSDVEIITRKDEDGAPLKTFGYVNINITDAEYKRCISILNKSTWKGGILLIQLAKESFLHRLAEERQQIVENAKSPKIRPQENVMESLKAAGVEHFHMKAAVPGTEIPGHKDWVVSKFGRVLPVLNLKCKGRKKVFKYDPSKHCHNIKRLETADDFTSVSKLTWEIPGGDDEISKKRRGEFPKQKSCPKRSKEDLSSLLSSFTQNNRLTTSSAVENKNPTVVQQNGLFAKGKQRPVDQNTVCVFDSDADSEDEIRRLVAEEQSRNPKQTFTEVEEDNLEVVGDDFVVKSTMWGKAEQDAVKSLLTSKEDEEYDSADTDEILTQSKTLCAEKSQDVEPASQESQTKSSKIQGKGNAEPVGFSSESESGSNEASDDDDDDDDDDSIDSDYEAMMGNCYRLDLSLADLEKLAKNAEVISDDEKDDAPKTPSVTHKNKGNNPEDILASILEDSTPEKENKKKKKQVTTASLPAFVGTKDLFGDSSPAPSEPSLKRTGQSLDNSSIEGPKRPKKDPKLSEQSVSMNKSPQQSSNHPHQQRLSTLTEVQPSTSANILEDKVANSSSEDDSSSEESDLSEEDSKDNQDNVFTSKTASTTQSVRTDQTLSNNLSKSNHPVSSTEGEKTTVGADNSNTPIKQVPKKTNPSRSNGSGSSSSESESSDEDKNSRTQLKDSKSSKKVDSHPTVLHPAAPDAQKQLQDNQKRLAALEQRQKENEEQKKLIQGALSNVDTVNTNRAKHIVFDSDGESDETSESPKEKLFEDSETVASKKNLKEKVSKKSDASKLFESSDDEDEDNDGEEDRFQIKPQFEGEAGKKLMELQSAFGTDSRFQMDSRFLETDDENKTLHTLNDSRRQPEKMFRDVSVLRYDPTCEEHAALEAKKEQPEKESKAARRKKRKEAEKLPEVSKEIYFDVSVDLKNVFGTLKENRDETETRIEKVSWDQEAEDPQDETQGDSLMEVSFTADAETHEDTTGGFKFSFFGESAVAETPSKTDEYKVETLKGATFSWQADPRFQDSSSDEEGVDEIEPDQSASSKTTEEPTPSKKAFFFFHRDDERLKEGPGMFCRNISLEEQRRAWEQTRLSLKEECRKKHRDAKRRQRPSLKS